MSTLKLSCPVKYCDKQPVITWCKLVDVENCTPLAENPNVKIWQHVPVNTEGNLTISYMVIQKITKYDSGLYRCGAFDSTAGHSITVNVTGKWSFYVFYCFEWCLHILYITFSSCGGLQPMSKAEFSNTTLPSLSEKGTFLTHLHFVTVKFRTVEHNNL